MIKIESIKNFFKMEASSGIILGLAAILAFIVANSGLSEAYFALFELNVLGLTLKYWINDGLMAIFFFMVGLEIKRELKLGHLSAPKKAALPFAAAVGGMLVPAVIYAFLNQNKMFIKRKICTRLPLLVIMTSMFVSLQQLHNKK